MTELTRRSFLAGAAAVATAPVVGTAHAKDTKLPRPDVKADYPAAGKTQALFDRVPDVEPDVANSGTFDFGVSNIILEINDATVLKINAPSKTKGGARSFVLMSSAAPERR